jgi:predicted phosphoadenosine phosphosulfate sulfurtransferase
MEQAGMSHNDQRCAPPFGEEPMRGLWTFACCFPDIWDKMQTRVPGAATGARYATSELYSFDKVPDKPGNVAWEQWIRHWLDKHPEPQRGDVAKRIRSWIDTHYRKTTEPILPKTPHPLTGICWNFLLTIAVRGDFKDRKQPNMNPKIFEQRHRAYDAERVALEGKKDGEASYTGQEEGRF